jgi:hypothetical protein
MNSNKPMIDLTDTKSLNAAIVMLQFSRRATKNEAPKSTSTKAEENATPSSPVISRPLCTTCSNALGPSAFYAGRHGTAEKWQFCSHACVGAHCFVGPALPSVQPVAHPMNLTVDREAA